jgi:hypothetical protein
MQTGIHIILKGEWNDIAARNKIIACYNELQRKGNEIHDMQSKENIKPANNTGGR